MTFTRTLIATAVGIAAVGVAAAPGSPARADDAWSPNYTVFPYNLWQNRVTPEMVDAERDACHWFNTRFDALAAQSWSFQNALHDTFDDWNAVRGAADVLKATIDASAAFLDPRVHTLYITNYPDQSRYSPLYNGDSFYHLWFQLTQLSDKIARQLPSGVINANNATMTVYGDVIRSSGVCNGA